jgi:hypothetical protein
MYWTLILGENLSTHALPSFFGGFRLDAFLSRNLKDHVFDALRKGIAGTENPFAQIATKSTDDCPWDLPIFIKLYIAMRRIGI